MFPAIQDSRCYLMNGGAVESFFISEDTPVGSVIGSYVIARRQARYIPTYVLKIHYFKRDTTKYKYFYRHFKCKRRPERRRRQHIAEATREERGHRHSARHEEHHAAAAARPRGEAGALQRVRQREVRQARDHRPGENETTTPRILSHSTSSAFGEYFVCHLR